MRDTSTIIAGLVAFLVCMGGLVAVACGYFGVAVVALVVGVVAVAVSLVLAGW